MHALYASIPVIEDNPVLVAAQGSIYSSANLVIINLHISKTSPSYAIKYSVVSAHLATKCLVPGECKPIIFFCLHEVHCPSHRCMSDCDLSLQLWFNNTSMEHLMLFCSFLKSISTVRCRCRTYIHVAVLSGFRNCRI